MHAPSSTQKPPSSIPVQLTRLVGRTSEIAEVAELLARTRLLTLTGAGGSGKTRIALEVARLEVARLEMEQGKREVVWVELAPVHDPSTLGNHVAAALGVRDEASRPTEDTIVSALGARRVLLVLDNCEHIVDACARFVDTLLRRCPRVSVLATSREALGIGGERSWLVPTLSLPPDGATTDAISHSDAVKLFVHRAQDVQPSFTLTHANAAAISAICRRLDGLPLAIELAAARVRVLAPEQIAERLDHAFRVLGGRPRGSLPRHRTLREAVDWSFRLLDETEARLLTRLSVFAGDFSLEDAEAVCGDYEVDAADILDALSALVDKSLAVMRESAGEARYALLETIRQFGAEQLASGGTLDVWRARHAHEYAARVAAAEPDFITARRPAAIANLSSGLDNLRAALAWSRDREPELHVRLASMLVWFWYSLGLWTEGRRWLEAALVLPAASARTRERAAALFGVGAIASLQAEPDVARRSLDECMAIARDIGDDRLLAYASNYMCMAYAGHGLMQGEPYARAALAWFETNGDLYGQRLARLLLATQYLALGQLDDAEREAALAVNVAREFGVDRELGIALQVHGTVLLHRGELDGAERQMIEALQRFKRDPQPLFMARAVDMLAIVDCRRGNVSRGVQRFGAADAERELIGASLFTLDRDRLAPYLDAARETIGAKPFHEALERGRRQRLATVIDEVLATPLAIAEAPLPLPLEQEAREVAKTATPAIAPAPTEPSAARGLDVQSLPRLRIAVDGRVLGLDAWRSAKPRELLVYLLLHPEGRTREQIGNTFWPDASVAAVKNNFHVTVHHLRKSLGSADWVRFEDDRYRIASDRGVHFDAATFESRVSSLTRSIKADLRAGSIASGMLCELQEALEIYRGDFLADESAGDWHLEQRDALRRQYTDALLLAGELFGRIGDHERASEMYRRLVHTDPTDEEACRHLMESLARTGARSEALRQFERLAARLEAEFDEAPSPATVETRDRIARGELAQS